MRGIMFFACLATWSLGDASLFVINKVPVLIYILVYIEEIVVAGNGLVEVNKVIQALSNHFFVKNHHELSYFLSMEAT